MTSYDPNPLPETADIIAQAPLSTLLQRVRSAGVGLAEVAAILTRLQPALESTHRLIEDYRQRLAARDEEIQALRRENDTLRGLASKTGPKMLPGPPPPPPARTEDLFGVEDIDIEEILEDAFDDEEVVPEMREITREFVLKVNAVAKAKAKKEK